MIVHALYEHDISGRPHGSSHIRLLRPLIHPSLTNKLTLTSSSQLGKNDKFDAVIVERWWKPDLSETDAINLILDVRQRKSTLIYTLDDNLLDLGLDEEGAIISESLQRATRCLVKEADGLIVSTPALKIRLQNLNKNIFVVPNALDETLFSPVNDNIAVIGTNITSVKHDDSITIGYMGTKTHGADLQMIIEPLRHVLTKYRDRVKLELIGVSTDNRILKCFTGFNVQVLDPGQADHYDQFVGWFTKTAQWDIGLAPLTDRRFNHFKSDIKFLDYGMLGIPGVFSRVKPYLDSVNDGETGILVDNDPGQWAEALTRLIENAELRHLLGANVTNYVTKQRTLRNNAINWYNAIQNIHQKALSKQRALPT